MLVKRTHIPFLPESKDYRRTRIQLTPKLYPYSAIPISINHSDFPSSELETCSKVFSIAPSVQNETSKGKE